MRKGEISRKTNETQIEISMNLDGTGVYGIDTGIGFFDHMLELFACHGSFDLTIKCKGDVKVDGHHSVEDVGICMGKLINQLLGDKRGIKRYSAFYVPMDESLARTVIDISGRPFLKFGASLTGKTGEFDAELIEEFFRALVVNAMITAHMDVLENGNLHHTAEALFKSFAHALSEAVKVVGNAVPSSKGVL